ncbi:glycosyltransferase [Alloprevotella sp. OH1205_COT-284]|uniref:WecB/TagA/CpsF family glycosyltransferase n=1 Tax=Alloprevotella sp. OH1205_COT-284 TaxID=2491043 RepID=UPI000F5FA3B1|nr:WecB/TagA/CpsF family glycosyltransferase [Alloprevotella sp. OH1205_COT-284]RRD80601.1 glycosyltransferase [Alloprevotella sp. OH1205_COT-284]
MGSILVGKIIDTNTLTIKGILETKGVYTFLNPVSYLDALYNKEVFAQFDGIFADGNLLVKAIKFFYGKVVERRSFDMTSLAPELFEYAGEQGKTIYIVASRQEQVETAVKIFTERFPKVQIIGYRNGFFTHDRNMDEEARYICKVNPDYLIVGMGALNQEKFLLKVKDAGFKGIGFTCGGFIHQTSQNEIDYYPMWVDKANLRFIYRMWKEPHTRVRYIKAGILFPIRFFIERIFG